MPDASCHHLQLVDGVDLEAEREKYKKWYAVFNHNTDTYETFEEMLKRTGKAQDADIEEFWTEL